MFLAKSVTVVAWDHITLKRFDGAGYLLYIGKDSVQQSKGRQPCRLTYLNSFPLLQCELVNEMF